jgi:methionyl aminopeptidase
LGAVGFAVQSFAAQQGRSVVKDYGGHGIGRQMHEDPHVPNIGNPDRGILLRTGLTLAIEPMLTTGVGDTRTLSDNWTVVTADGSLAAHFEHTVAIMPEGGRLLTPRLSPVLE